MTSMCSVNCSYLSHAIWKSPRRALVARKQAECAAAAIIAKADQSGARLTDGADMAQDGDPIRAGLSLVILHVVKNGLLRQPVGLGHTWDQICGARHQRQGGGRLEVHWKRFKLLLTLETISSIGFRLLQKGYKGNGVRAPFQRHQTKEALGSPAVT